MKKTSLLLLLCCIFQSTLFSQTPKSTPDLNLSSKGECVLTTGNFADTRFETIIGFNGSSIPNIQLIVGSTDPNVTITGVVLYKNNFASFDSVAYYPENNAMDTLTLDSLVFGQAYVLKLIRSSNVGTGNYEICLSDGEKTDYNGTMTYTNAQGDTIQTCVWTLLDQSGLGPNIPLYGQTFFHDTLHFQNILCGAVSVCPNEKTCITMTNTALTGNPLMNIAGALISGGIPVIIEYNSDSTQICFTFPNPGDYTMVTSPYSDGNLSPWELIAAGYPWPVNQYFAEVPATATQQAIPAHFEGACAWYTAWHVSDTVQPFALNNDTICNGETFTLSSNAGQTISNVYIDGIDMNSDDNASSYTSPPILGLGMHYFTYSVNNGCAIEEFIDSVFVVGTGLDVTISACGLMEVDFLYCPRNTQGSFIFNFGDGTDQIITYTGNPIHLIHQYDVNLGTLVWTANFNSLLVPPGGIVNYFTQTGTVQNIENQSLEFIAQGTYLCEMTSFFIQIDTTLSYSSIVWTANATDPTLMFPPVYPIVGQGTNTINVASWATYNDVTIIVTATDINGCKYKDTLYLKGCCASTASNNEYFETTYYTYTTDLQPEFSNLTGGGLPLPNSDATNFLTRAISLPTAPAITSFIATSHLAPTTFAQFILANPSTWNAATLTLTIPNQWLYLNNDLLIENMGLVRIVNSPFIRISQNRAIILGANTKLEIINSTLAPKCDQMWKGIEAANNTSTLTVSNSNIIGAITGVYCKNNTQAVFKTSKFIDNRIGISIDNYSFGGLIDVAGNYFGDRTTLNLLAPYQLLNKCYAGIYVNKTNNLVIGKKLTLATIATEGNVFHNIQNGVVARESALVTSRNTYINILQQSSFGSTDILLAAAIDLQSNKTRLGDINSPLCI